jgi:hypothetical protein
MSGLVARWQTFGRQDHPRAVDLSADPVGRVPLRRRQAVAVDPQSDRRIGVAEAGADDVHRDAGHQCQRRADVPQVVAGDVDDEPVAQVSRLPVPRRGPVVPSAWRVDSSPMFASVWDRR